MLIFGNIILMCREKQLNFSRGMRLKTNIIALFRSSSLYCMRHKPANTTPRSAEQAEIGSQRGKAQARQARARISV